MSGRGDFSGWRAGGRGAFRYFIQVSFRLRFRLMCGVVPASRMGSSRVSVRDFCGLVGNPCNVQADHAYTQPDLGAIALEASGRDVPFAVRAKTRLVRAERVHWLHAGQIRRLFVWGRKTNTFM